METSENQEKHVFNGGVCWLLVKDGAHGASTAQKEKPKSFVIKYIIYHYKFLLLLLLIKIFRVLMHVGGSKKMGLREYSFRIFCACQGVRYNCDILDGSKSLEL